MWLQLFNEAIGPLLAQPRETDDLQNSGEAFTVQQK
jgi:hypothetical protein